MVTAMYERFPVDAPPEAVVAELRAELRERGIKEYAVVDHGHDMADAGRPAYPAWTLIFGNPAAGATLLARDLAAAVDIPLRLAVIGRDGSCEIVLRNMRTLIDVDIADGFTKVLRELAEAARDRL
jgi:uncharacterized protein (DUF302 family)